MTLNSIIFHFAILSLFLFQVGESYGQEQEKLSSPGTILDNSTLFSSINSEPSMYSVINHCRWNGFINILPSLIFKKTFKTYVLENFAANNVSAIPILYKLA